MAIYSLKEGRWAVDNASMRTKQNIGPFNGCTRRWLALAAVVIACLASVPSAGAAEAVRAWEENVTIPTYAAGDPEPNPMFYFGRASQGAQGRVYPYPLYDSLTGVKEDKVYRMLRLENEYIKIGILPEVGGRLFEAVDKTNSYDFIYHQHVIKPALIGLIGAWISGGIEWNIPHHHRATTFLPVQSKIEENADGSKTIWVGELELRSRMRWAVGYTLHPGKSVLECQVRIINRTPLPNSMLCFANVAVHANDQYQVIFPPSTQHVTFHGKREFTTWPIATTRFNGVDFTGGVDVSWYKNHQNAMSMFAWNYDDDFFGGYDHGKNAGIVSVADHHVVPGKKFWTWGNGPRGKMWDKILTDDDGPYIELMTGAYSDNQPDYSWLQPYETKSFQMNWYPIRDIGGFKKANLDAAVNLEVTEDEKAKTAIARLGFYTTGPRKQAVVLLKAGQRSFLEEKIDIDPGKPFTKQLSIPAEIDEHDLRASLSADGKELIAYSPVRLKPEPMPDPVVPPEPPKSIKTVEELYLAGQRIEQFHAPGQEPEPYWEEALARDRGDARVNTALGIRKLRQARYSEAEQHFRTAIKRLSANYTSPKDGEPFYYLGLALDGQGKTDQAFDAFFKATWSQAWRGPAYFYLAQIASRRHDFAVALDYVDHSLEANELNLQALNLKSALLRHLDRPKDALVALNSAAARADRLNVELMSQRFVAEEEKNTAAESELISALGDQPAAALEAAVDSAKAGFWDDSEWVLQMEAVARAEANRSPDVSPLTEYLRSEAMEHRNPPARGNDSRRIAKEAPPDYVFPFQQDLIPFLRHAIDADPKDARAPYYLGNLLFDWQPEEAVKLWERSAELDPSFAIVHRNLAAAYSHQKPTPDIAKAIGELEKAVACEKKYALHFTELDELYAQVGKAPEDRLALLEKSHDVVLKRDDSLSREIGMKVFAAKYDEAIQLMTGRKFSVWEGGTLEVADHWVNAHLLRGRDELAAEKFREALADFQAANSISDNLPNDRGFGARTAEISYWIGMGYDGLGEVASAKKAWEEAVAAGGPGFRGGPDGRFSVRQVQTYYQALAKQKLGQTDAAQSAFHAMLDAANRTLSQKDDAGAAVEPLGPRLSPSVRLATAYYMRGLAHLGLDDTDAAKVDFEHALQSAPDALGPHVELATVAR
jgi:tetratricopeptide (TPR) repeat protein